jgi:hypothetical protein
MWQVYETYSNVDQANATVELLVDQGGYQAYVRELGNGTYAVLFCD